ncbi:hypothetical protein QQS21_003601 [Conoideocrella luteorostrata]|uniref:Tyrosine specific protein phosphatases domain-containing protein n=1 Tax=Conoideocrella luteorostrata TaxID=1105319 RepID=A0AAJ0G0E7_9HYPO|nr:hypothetical protein QQS21_003601 [Conoideocrella luteorostrata]
MSIRVSEPIPLEGTLNMRDVGGYATTDGRHVLKGRIYRSANLAQINPGDIKKLEKLGIDTVIDLRGPREAREAPDHLPHGTNYVNSPIIGSSGGDEIDDETIAQLLHNAGLPDSMLQKARVLGKGPYYRMLYLISMYGSDAHIAKLRGYRTLFHQLMALPNSSSLLFHCTGGRDRTGVGAALLLKALDAPDEAIEADFVASNKYLQVDADDPTSERFLQFQSANVFLQPSSNQNFQQTAKEFGASPDQIRGAVELRPELLRRMFCAIDDKYGSYNKFLEQEMGISAQERQHLKEKFRE